MMSRIRNGEKVWNELRKQGGFIHTAADGSKTVRFNRGKKPDRYLVSLLAANRDDLKLWIDEHHRRAAAAWGAERAASPLGMGPFQPQNPPESNRQGREVCDCNAETRFRISGGAAKNAVGGVLAVLITAISVAGGASGGFFCGRAAESMVGPEIGRVRAPGAISAGCPVGLRHVLSSFRLSGVRGAHSLA